jgi:Rrf2 family protein
MILSRADVLAITAVVDIAINGRERRVRGRDIEMRLGLSRRYLEKALQSLAGGQILTGERGAFGGYRLARAPHRITLKDILLTLRATRDKGMDQARSSIIENIVIPALHHAQLELSESLQRITIHDLALSSLDHAKDGFGGAPDRDIVKLHLVGAQRE